MTYDLMTLPQQINNIVITFIFAFFYYAYFEKNNSKRNFIILLVGQFVMTILTLMISMEDLLLLPILRQVILLGFSIIMIKILYHEKLIRIFLAICMLDSIILLGESLIMAIGLIFTNFSMDSYQNLGYLNIPSYILYDLFIIFCILRVRKFVDTDIYKNLDTLGIVVIILMLLCFIGISFLFAANFMSFLSVGTVEIQYAVILFVITSILLVSLGIRIIRRTRLISRNKSLLSIQNDLDMQYDYLYQVKKDTLDLIDMMQKKMANIDNPTTMSEIKEKYQELIKEKFSNDEVLNSIFRIYADLFRRKGIDYKFDIDSDSRGLMSHIEIVKVFTNILDNAFEAVEFNEEPFKHIELSFKRQGDMVLIECKNNVSQNIVQRDKRVSGEGTTILREIVEIHKGYYTYHVEDGIFSLRIIF